MTAPGWDVKLICRYLSEVVDVSRPPRVSVEDFVKKSDTWCEEFPTATCRVKYHLKAGKSKDVLEDQINSAYPLCHFSVINLLITFLDFKKQYGTKSERSLYENLGLMDLVERILRKRPITFYGPNDKFCLHSNKTGQGGFEKIGTDYEDPHLRIWNYMSYDEMKISALLTVSSKSFFVNDGNRKNQGKSGEKESFQESGVIVGMVGARLKKVEYMEWQDCIVTPKQNTPENGYGIQQGQPKLQHIWNKFYEGMPTWNEIDTKDSKYRQVKNDTFLNTEVYKKRIRLTALTLIAEATARAEANKLKAYIHVVGLGLGVWCASNEQDKYFVEAWGEVLQKANTSSIAYVDFSWINAENCLGVKNGEKFKDKEIIIRFSERALHAPVPEGTLLVDSYAWDGNALPGNEYWLNMLSSTGDGAAACSSGVAELHNSYINTTAVCGSNLNVVAPNGKIHHISEYARMYLQRYDKESSSK
ncbi:unnamed protein product [Meganyctiphanes norvegica]|uniref:Uncharacterized protein n=1 Tax=Meganyctiphanes norvegica TaxID=48144 RepID=A0AAV2SMM2_MEGNR